MGLWSRCQGQNPPFDVHLVVVVWYYPHTWLWLECELLQARRPDVAASHVSAGPETQLGREFRLYATGRVVSVIGDRIAAIALVFLVIHLSGSFALAVGVFYLCGVLPSLAGGLMAGVMVDHFNRKRLMIFCDVARAILLVLVPAVSALTLWTIYPLVIVLFALTLLFDTAATAAIPDVVPEGQMIRANSILQAIQQGADLANAVGGALVFALGFQAPFYIDAGTFVVSAACVTVMRLPGHVAKTSLNSAAVVESIREGVGYLIRTPFLKWSTFAFAVAPLAGGVAFVLAPLYANKALSHSPGLVGPFVSGAFRFSVLEVGIGFGALCGSFCAAWLARRWPRGRVFGLGILGAGVSYSLLATTSNLFVAIFLMALAGLFNAMFVIAGTTLVQALTPTELRGRVVAARVTVINGALAIGSVLGGLILLDLSYWRTWFLVGAVIALASLFVWVPREVRSQP